MVMILERGQRQNSIWCFTKSDKFYPICYTDIVGSPPSSRTATGSQTSTRS